MARPPKIPYTSVSDVDAFFERVETIGEPKPPKKVDSSWVATYGFQTAHPSAIPSMLRWLNIINDEGESTGVWNELRVDSKRQGTLQRLVKEAYSAVFDEVDVEKAAQRDLRGAFVSAYSIGVPNRHINCFLALCRHAGIETAVEASARESKTPATAKPKPPKAAASPKSTSTPSVKPKPKTPQPLAQSGGLNVTVNIEIPSDWTEEQIRERIATVRRAASEDEV
ncbi:MAG TPA: DUF5343 domain-containing protein [Dehalococcoidia bacterium]|nr:DUF5343 domain-containing protein [Dehalococcoidia bacterium]